MDDSRLPSLLTASLRFKKHTRHCPTPTHERSSIYLVQSSSPPHHTPLSKILIQQVAQATSPMHHFLIDHIIKARHSHTHNSPQDTDGRPLQDPIVSHTIKQRASIQISKLLNRQTGLLKVDNSVYMSSDVTTKLQSRHSSSQKVLLITPESRTCQECMIPSTQSLRSTRPGLKVV